MRKLISRLLRPERHQIWPKSDSEIQEREHEADCEWHNIFKRLDFPMPPPMPPPKARQKRTRQVRFSMLEHPNVDLD